MKQIVGGSLTQDGASLRTNFVSDRGAAWYADLYRRDGLHGGHVIKLGPGNEPCGAGSPGGVAGGLQVGGRHNAGEREGMDFSRSQPCDRHLLPV